MRNFIGDYIYNDTNGNGVFDGSDTGLANITVRAWNDTNSNGVVDAGEPVTASNTTNSTGHYTLNLSTGSYVIQVNYDFSSTLYSFRNTTKLLQPITVSGDNLTIDFGFNTTLLGNGRVNSSVKISDGLGGFSPSALVVGDNFGGSVANLGDLNGDGIIDLAVGAYQDENSEAGEGAIYILFMHTNGTVNTSVKISDGLGGFNPSGLDGSDRFGKSITNLGDLDGDGVQDLAVGAYLDENSQASEGAVYILFMHTNGTVNTSVKISDGLGGFNPSGLDGSDFFGSSVANLGDLNGDGIIDLAVGASNDENSEAGEGAIYILFMHTNGTVNTSVKISDGLGGFNPSGLSNSDAFGYSLANLGDLNGDGIIDLAVGAYQDENSQASEGAIYILFMYTNGSVNTSVKISDGLNGFNQSSLDSGDLFGSSLANLGDLNGDGIQDLVVGAEDDENGQASEGAIYILFMYLKEFINPNVSGPKPSGTEHTTAGTIEIGVNVTDNTKIDTVSVNVTIPNGTIVSVSLTNVTNVKYNASYLIPNVIGQYNLTFIATDFSNNFNTSVTSNFAAVVADDSGGSSSGGGGGGGGSASGPVITITPSTFNLVVRENSEEQRVLSIENTGSSQAVLNVIQDGLEGIVTLDKTNIILDPGNKTELKLFITVFDGVGVFSGTISIGSSEIPVTITVKAAPITEESRIIILNEGGQVVQGDDLMTEVFLDLLKEYEGLNLESVYIIRDLNGFLYDQ